MINKMVMQFKQAIIKAVNESQLPPTIISACIGEVKGIVDLQAEQAIQKELADTKEGEPDGETLCKD